eukprot:TRINITY_DN23751_c0_g1_i1.p1 TRINITY_DN23751_c0_g1~~TRINITY_DN23751_c0_g1_i1.p1  ORF type:complete len:287 (+),score=48.82 TRINITY_DN23751_c0_g1_i1:126-863(+)
MLAALEKELCVDPARYYASGFSNGGLMSWRALCERSNRIAAAVVVSGPLGNSDVEPCMASGGDAAACVVDPSTQAKCFDASRTACASPHTPPLELFYSCTNMSRPVPVMVVWGADDPHVPFYGGIGVESVEGFATPPVLLSVDFIAKQYNCSARPFISFRNESAGGFAECSSYSGCQSSANVTLCVAKHNGHAWPGGLPYQNACNPMLPEYNYRRCERIKERGAPISSNFVTSQQLFEFFGMHTL